MITVKSLLLVLTVYMCWLHFGQFVKYLKLSELKTKSQGDGTDSMQGGDLQDHRHHADTAVVIRRV